MNTHKATRILLKTTLAISLSSVLAGTASAAAFQLWEQNGAGVGDYHAGGAAEADDASTGFYNPAGLVRIKNPQVVMGMVLINTDFRFKGSESVILDGTPLQTQTGVAQGGGFNDVPDFHFATPLTKRLYFGFGITTPFGLQTDWGNNSVVRYSATKSSIQTINLNPNLAFLVNHNFSIGAGVDYQYLHGEFDEAVLDPEQVVNYLSINKGQDWGLGWNAGALLQFNQSSVYGTRIGLNYRSRVLHTLKGDSQMVQTSNNQVVNRSGDVRASVALPATSMLSLFQQLGSQWSVMSTATFTQWTSISGLTLKNVAGVPNLTNNKVNSSVHFGYHNSWNFALGAHYQYKPDWMFRFGTGYDFTPTTDGNRDIRLPDQNRFALATGVQYKPSHALSFDFGWTHLFVKKAKVNKEIEIAKTVTDDTDSALTNGTVSGLANVIGMQMTWNIT